MHGLIDKQTSLRPHALAIDAWDGRLTYLQLQRSSEMLAKHLVQLGVRSDMLVPVIFEKSVKSVIALLAVVKAGGGIVPLDPALPLSRLHMIIRDTNASIVIASRLHHDKIPENIEHRLILDDEFLALVSTLYSGDINHTINPSPDNALYVIFTSGTTGKPKGVVISHSAFCSSSYSFTKAIFLTTPYSRVLQYSSFTFDACIIEIFSTLTVGSCICIPSDEDRMDNIVKSMTDMRVNWAILTPSVASLIDPTEVPLLEVLCLAGEALPQALADVWAPHVKAINVYGPTECCILNIISAPRIKGVKSNSLGKPRNCAVWIVDDRFEQLVPLNTVGEIVIEGPTLARGYLGDKSKTAIAFLQAPRFLKGVVDTSSRFYRTGDLGRMNSDGTIDYFGRKDSQVKIRGQRVELGEIEHHLKNAIDSSLDVVVELLKPENGALLLVAFVSRKADARSASESSTVQLESITFKDSDLKSKSQLLQLTKGVSERLDGILPAYMIPKVFVPCKVLPQTSSGKTDRKKLRMLGESMSAEQLVAANHSHAQASGHATLTPAERSLRQVWAKVLDVHEKSIQLEDDFFKLGGDSIGAIKVVAACRKASLQVRVASIFKNSILRDMAQVCNHFSPVKSVRNQPFSFLKEENLVELLAEAALQCEVDQQSIEDLSPCTPLQEGLMAVNMTRPSAYTARFVHALPESIDIPHFKKTWDSLYAESPILRTRFVTTTSEGSLQAVIREPIHWVIGNDLDTYLTADEESHMLPGLPLCRFAVIASSQKRTLHFVWTIHHMLYDGWSISLIIRRFNAVYSGASIEDPVDFRNFLAYVHGLDKHTSAAYWTRELQGVPQSTFPTPAKPGHRSIARAVIRDYLPIQPETRSGLTMATLVRAAWALMINSYSKTDDVLFGSINSGRATPLENIENIEGPVLATVPIRLKLQQDTPVIDFLKHVQDHASSMIPYEQAGIQQIRRLSEDCKRACEFQNLLVVQSIGDQDLSEPLGAPIYREEFTTFPVTCEARLKAEGVGFATHVDEDIASPVAVAEAIIRVKTVLKQLAFISSSSTIKICELVFEEADNQNPGSGNQLLAMPRIVKACIHDLISEKSQAQADAEAVCSSSNSISYRVLDLLSFRLAGYLVRTGLAPGSIVPIIFEKSVWTVVAMLGIMKAGFAFAPLDPSQPASRLESIMKEINANVVLTSALHAEATIFDKLKQVIIDGPFLEKLPCSSKANKIKVSPDDLAYVIFTSGSTGMPKGVLVSHLAFASSAVAHAEGHMLRPESRVLQFASYSFDACLVEILTTLIQGGTVCVPTEAERVDDVGGFMDRMKIDFAILTPSVARLIRPIEVPSLKVIILAGEAAEQALVEKWLQSGVEVVNGYGPSECAVVAANQTLKPGMDSRNIGQAVGCMAWVVDPDNADKLLPNGEVGELLIEGPTLAKGYLNDPEKTALAFIYDPLWSRNSLGPRRMYKTGDLVRRSHDGTMVYVGRKDLQVKINGQRVELGDIETHLVNCEGVDGATILFPSSGSFSRQVIAIIHLGNKISRLQTSAQLLTTLSRRMATIRDDLSIKIPSFMVPRQWISTHSLPNNCFPLTASGKIDRIRLATWVEGLSPSETISSEKLTVCKERLSPICANEEPAWALATKISSMLSGKELPTDSGGFPEISISATGLDSINMMSLLHFISTIYHVKIGMHVLMDPMTSIRSLASFITQSGSKYGTCPSTGSVDIMTEINRHDATIAAAQLGSPVVNGLKDTNSLGDSGDKACPLADRSHVHTPTSSKESNDLRCTTRPSKKRPGPISALQTVLLTGANGFLGTQILRQLLERQEVQRVVAIVRGNSGQHARTRIIDVAMKALWWTELHREKLEVWCGDLSRPQLGLDAVHWKLLSETNTFDAFVHNGASVHWNKTYAALEAVNVLSTMDLLRLSVTGERPRLAYISGGRQWLSENEDDESVANEISKSIGYSQTKFVSEVVAKRTAHRCEPGHNNIAIIKPGLIIGTSQEGIANPNDFIWRLAAACISIKGYNAGEGGEWLHLSDVARIASIVIDAAVSNTCPLIPVHYVHDGLTWSAFWSVLRVMGYELTGMSSTEWNAAIMHDLSKRKEEHPMWPLAHMLNSTGSDIHPATVSTLEEIPPLHLRLAIRKNVESLGKIGFIPVPIRDSKNFDRS